MSVLANFHSSRRLCESYAKRDRWRNRRSVRTPLSQLQSCSKPLCCMKPLMQGRVCNCDRTMNSSSSALKGATGRTPAIDKAGVLSNANTMPYIPECVRAWATVGEIRAALEEMFGAYEESALLDQWGGPSSSGFRTPFSTRQHWSETPCGAPQCEPKRKTMPVANR